MNTTENTTTQTQASPKSRVAGIGDVHGHLGELLGAFWYAGVRYDRAADSQTSIRWPEGLSVIQVGDQIHKGPDSAAVLAATDEAAEAAGGRYIDLVGNHEAQYYPGGRTIAPAEAGVAASLRARPRAYAAVAVPEDASQPKILYTHAGLTHGFWERHCSGAEDAEEVAEILNSMWAEQHPDCHRAGIMINGKAPDMAASPIWAHCSHELLRSWQRAGRFPDFDQVVGHTHPIHPRLGRPEELAVDESTGHASYMWSGRAVVRFIDNGNGASPAFKGLKPDLRDGYRLAG